MAEFSLGGVLMAMAAFVGAVVLLSYALYFIGNIWFALENKKKPKKQEKEYVQVPELEFAYLARKRELEVKIIKHALEDKYQIVFYEPGVSNTARGYHYGTGLPGCPQDMHHHHDELCLEGCRG